MLEEDASRHVVQVLRMKKGDVVKLTDGKGNIIKNQDSKVKRGIEVDIISKKIL